MGRSCPRTTLHEKNVCSKVLFSRHLAQAASSDIPHLARLVSNCKTSYSCLATKVHRNGAICRSMSVAFAGPFSMSPTAFMGLLQRPLQTFAVVRYTEFLDHHVSAFSDLRLAASPHVVWSENLVD